VLLADQIDEGLTQAQSPYRSRGLSKTHTRGRYPRPPVRVDEHTTELAGSPVFYRSAEVPGPPALFLHGIPTSSDDFVPFLERTGGLAPDLIGFGRSGKGGHLDYSINGHADFVTALLDHLGIERVQLVMHDWGAAAGLAFAQRQPDRVERVVLIDAVPLLPGFQWSGLIRTLQRPLVGELVMGSVTRGLFNRTLRKGGPWTDQQLAAVWRQFDQGTQRAVLRLLRDATPPRLAQAGEGLGELSIDALVIWGEDDPWLPLELGETYAASLPRASLERVADAGHWPWLQKPTVIDRVAQFLG
jgi:pimeloyl-ACP methyl ester carboxylesterase